MKFLTFSQSVGIVSTYSGSAMVNPKVFIHDQAKRLALMNPPFKLIIVREEEEWRREGWSA